MNWALTTLAVVVPILGVAIHYQLSRLAVELRRIADAQERRYRRPPVREVELPGYNEDVCGP